MKRLDPIRHLEAHGCNLHRDTGKHAIYVNPNSGATAPVPRHREVNDFTARAICRQLGIPPL